MTHEEFFSLLEKGFYVKVVGNPINQDLNGSFHFVPPRKYEPFEAIELNEVVQDSLRLTLRDLAEMLGVSLFNRGFSLEVEDYDQAQ